MNKPNFKNTKGNVDNNTPLNPDAKVQKTEDFKNVKNKYTGNFQKKNENEDVKAPKKDYLEGSTDIKYKEDDVEIEKRVFQSNKTEANFIEINKDEDV